MEVDERVLHRLALNWRVLDPERLRRVLPARVLQGWVRNEGVMADGYIGGDQGSGVRDQVSGVGGLPFPWKRAEAEPETFRDPWEIAEALKAWGRGEM